MSDIIPSISWADFVKIFEAGRLADLKACEVLSIDGEHPFTAIIFHGDRYGNDNIRINAEFLANRSNIIGGLDPEEVLKMIKPVSVYPNLEKGRAARQANIARRRERQEASV